MGADELADLENEIEARAKAAVKAKVEAARIEQSAKSVDQPDRR